MKYDTELIKEVVFDEQGLIPAVLQDVRNGRVLMTAYMNREALEKTLETGEAWFFSRRRQELWHKGATSGQIQRVHQILVDCDGDTLLLKVTPVSGGACHTGHGSCFFRPLTMEERDVGAEFQTAEGDERVEFSEANSNSQAERTGHFAILDRLYRVILDRRAHPTEGSYTCYLWEKGQDKILKKVGEEAAEVIIGSKNNRHDEVVYEAADLIYHLLVLLAWHGITPREVMTELSVREEKR